MFNLIKIIKINLILLFSCLLNFPAHSMIISRNASRNIYRNLKKAKLPISTKKAITIGRPTILSNTRSLFWRRPESHANPGPCNGRDINDKELISKLIPKDIINKFLKAEPNSFQEQEYKEYIIAFLCKYNKEDFVEKFGKDFFSGKPFRYEGPYYGTRHAEIMIRQDREFNKTYLPNQYRYDTEIAMRRVLEKGIINQDEEFTNFLIDWGVKPNEILLIKAINFSTYETLEKILKLVPCNAQILEAAIDTGNKKIVELIKKYLTKPDSPIL